MRCARPNRLMPRWAAASPPACPAHAPPLRRCGARFRASACASSTAAARPLRFGGQVIKNVAGYDVSRLMVGALGTLGLITEVSLKVLPRPVEEISLQFELDEAAAILQMNQWAGQPLPLSATSWHAGVLSVRLSGAAPAVRAAHTRSSAAKC